MRHATLRETLVIRKRRKKERERERGQREGRKREGRKREREGGRERERREGGRERERREEEREKETYCNTSYTIVFAYSLLQYEYDHRLISKYTHL